MVSDWPNKGEIVFENVSLRYNADRNPVITDLSLKILAGQKVVNKDKTVDKTNIQHNNIIKLYVSNSSAVVTMLVRW